MSQEAENTQTVLPKQSSDIEGGMKIKEIGDNGAWVAGKLIGQMTKKMTNRQVENILEVNGHKGF